MGGAMVGLWAIGGCATSPLGRSQMILLPAAQLDSMGTQSFEEMKQKTPIEKDPKINQYVKCIAQAVADQAKDAQVETWEIVVFKDPTANAFALPGGKIGVHTGILPVAKEAGQLAAVLGHEVGHVIAQHGNERVSEALAIQGGLAAFDTLAKNQQTVTALLGMGAQFGVMLPHSRTQESEADIIGLKLMAQAGFDPHASVELWKNMKAAGGGQPPEFMSTHPSNDRRIQELNDGIPKVMADFEGARAQGRNPQCGQL